jgi:hypothetical protein
MRDFQRQKIYDSDRQFRRKYKSELKFYKNLSEIQIFLNEILANKWFKKFNIKHIHVYCSKGNVAYGWLEDNYTIAMKLPKWSKNQATILHEIAHGICDRIYFDRDIAPHGIEYADMYLNLIFHILGENTYQTAIEIFIKNKVKYIKEVE